MDLRSLDVGVRSLERAILGETVVLRSMLFDEVRMRLHQVGLGVGDRVRLRDRTVTHIVVETGDGREVQLERRTARFIQVATVGRRFRRIPAARRPAAPTLAVGLRTQDGPAAEPTA